MSCRITSDTIRTGIENLIKNEMLKSGVFTQNDNVFRAQYSGYQQVINDINGRFSETMLRRIGDREYEITVPSSLLKNYTVTSENGKEVVKIIGLYGDFNLEPNSWNNGETFMSLSYPEISEMTNDKLKSFLTSINPEFNVQEIDNLSVDGVTSLKDFLIQVRTLSKLSTLPEEVSHVLIEMLPDNNELKQSLISNITSFPIYSATLSKYKDEYTKSNGSPNYDKIKREAAAKLVGEFIHAISSGDTSRVEALTRTKEGFLKKWLNAFLKWLGLAISDKTKVYSDIAGYILTGENTFELKDPSSIGYTDNYFYRLSEDELYDNALQIIDAKPPKLLDIITSFSKEFSAKFREILKNEKYSDLNKQLKTADDGTIGKLNALTEIKFLLSDAGYDLKDALNADSYLKGIKEFLEAVDRLDTLTAAMIKVITNKEKAKGFDEAIKNVKELEGYISIYDTFKNIISADLASALVESGIGSAVVDSIISIDTKFKTVNEYIMSRIRGDLSVIYSHILNDTNQNITHTIDEDIEREKSKKIPNPKILKQLKEKKKNIIQTDDKVMSMLLGKGKDIDGLSIVNHLINAAIMNGDMYVAGIDKYTQDRINIAHQKAKEKVLDLYDQVDKIQSKLGESAEETGKKITFIDHIYDKASGEDRSVLTFLNPHMNIQPAIHNLREKMSDALGEYVKVDQNDKEEKEAALAKFRAAKKAFNDFHATYMNRPFTKEYYQFKDKYDTNPIYVIAKEEYDKLTAYINGLEDILKAEPENESAAKSIALARREKANMMFEYDMEGEKKEGADLEMANILKQYFEESSNYKELDEAQSERSYLIARNRYKQKVDFAINEVKKEDIQDIDEAEIRLRELLQNSRLKVRTLYNMENDSHNLDLKLVKNLLMEKWDNQNKTIQRNEKFYEDEKILRDEIEELQKKGEMSPVEKDIANAYLEIRNILFGSRNNIGEINPDSLSEEEKDKINNLEDLIEDLKQEKPGVPISTEDMTPEDKAQYEMLDQIIRDPSLNSSRKRSAIIKKNRIIKKYKNSDRNKKIKELIEVLGILTDKRPTEYYWDKMATMLSSVNKFIQDAHEVELTENENKELLTLYSNLEECIDTQNYDRLDYDIFTSDMFKDFLKYGSGKNYSTVKWFLDNHREKTVFDHLNEKYTRLPYVRSAIYSYIEPTQKIHQKEVYNKKYQKYKVKDDYRTPEVVGETVSNREIANGFSEFLPLTVDQGAPMDSPYINHEYYHLKNSTDPKDQLYFQYLELLKQSNLEHQEKAPSRLRSWMAAPVIELTHLEGLQHVPQKAKYYIDKVKSIFNKDKVSGVGDAEAQVEGDDTIEQIDQITQKIIRDKIPKLGMSQKVPVERVSRNVLRATTEFIIKAHEFEERSELQPIHKAILDVMKDNEFKNNMGNKERSKIFEKIYSQKILQEVPDNAFNNKFIRRVTRFLTGNTALRLMIDPIGGVFNYGSATVNNLIESFAMKYVGPQDYAKGVVLATDIDLHLAADFNRKTGLSFQTLLYNYFDFVQGDFEEDLLDRASSKNKKASIKQLSMIPRKVGELNAQTAMGMAILERTKVKNELDGKEYPMHQIFKKQGNKLVLKEGFPQEYNPLDGEKFMKIKALINRVNLELHGNYAKINQTEASRYSVGKLAENMKRWFMPAVTRRMGRETADITYEGLTEGYYTTTGRALYNIFSNLLFLDFTGAKSQADFFLNTPRYRQNLQRTGAEFAQAMLLFLTFALLLGYWGDDKNKNLDKNGWLQNTSILIALRIFSETTAYFPLPPFGFQEMKRNALSPFAMPADAVSNMAALGELGLYQVLYWFGADSFKSNLYYSKDSGYWFSQKGDSKFFKYLLKTFGYSGYTFEPGTYIKTFNNLQQRLK